MDQFFPSTGYGLQHSTSELPERVFQEGSVTSLSEQEHFLLVVVGKKTAMSDLAISRAGAASCAELALFGVPALFVPYPYAAKNHQRTIFVQKSA